MNLQVLIQRISATLSAAPIVVPQGRSEDSLSRLMATAPTPASGYPYPEAHPTLRLCETASGGYPEAHRAPASYLDGVLSARGVAAQTDWSDRSVRSDRFVRAIAASLRAPGRAVLMAGL